MRRKILSVLTIALFAPSSVMAYTRTPDTDPALSPVLIDVASEVSGCPSNWNIGLFDTGTSSILFTPSTTGTTQYLTCGQDMYSTLTSSVTELTCPYDIDEAYISCTPDPVGTLSDTTTDSTLLESNWTITAASSPTTTAPTSTVPMVFYDGVLLGFGALLAALGAMISILIWR